MPRLTVALLAALDAAIAAAVGLAVLLAPLTLLWTLAFGGTADWGALWSATGTLWQFGHGVPLAIDLPAETVVAAGIAPDAARFTLSVTPLALLAFTVLFAARSGRRASGAGHWVTGGISGTVVFAAISVGVALTASAAVAAVALWLAALLPTAVYAAGALCGAVRHAWTEGDGGIVDRMHDTVDGWGDWSAVPGEAVRGAAVAVVTLTGAAAIGVVVMIVLRGGEVVALYEGANVDALGTSVISLGQLAYLPTLLVWAIAWIAGPGFAVGAGTAVSPAGTQLGVVPGIPVLGLLPANDSMWALVIVLVPVAAGALAGWMVRSRLVWERTAIGAGPRAVLALAIALLSGGIVALASALASGSIGPGRLAVVGPSPGLVALAVGAEVLIGAAILLLAPRNREELAEERTDRWRAEMAASGTPLD